MFGRNIFLKIARSVLVYYNIVKQYIFVSLGTATVSTFVSGKISRHPFGFDGNIENTTAGTINF